MRINKIRLALATAAAILPGVAAPSAMAAPDVANCQYTGTASTSGVNWLGAPLSSPNTGSFTFSQLTFTCAGVGDPTTGAAAGVVTVNLPSSGTFNNILCGTGTADGSGTASASDVAGVGSAAGEFNGAHIGYHITFAGGQGALQGSGTDADGDPLTIAGTASIVATGGGTTPNLTTCTDNFEVAGASTIASP